MCEQWRVLVFSPKRACLAWARLKVTRLRCRRELSFRRVALVLSERTQRLLFLFFEPPPRQKGLAWAREASRLSESWARWCLGIVSIFVFGCLIHVWLDGYVKVWDEWICMSKRMYELWMMNLDDSWHVINMKWSVMKVTWNWYEHECDTD